MKRLSIGSVLFLAVVAPGCRRASAPDAPAPSTTTGAAATSVSLHGASLSGAPAVSLAALLADPLPHAGKTVGLEGAVRQACTNKGCWMELAAAPKGPGVRVRFKDYGFFVPTNSAGAMAKVEGEVKVAELSEGEAAHWASEGAQIPRGPDGKAREVQLIATGVELRRP